MMAVQILSFHFQYHTNILALIINQTQYKLISAQGYILSSYLVVCSVQKLIVAAPWRRKPSRKHWPCQCFREKELLSPCALVSKFPTANEDEGHTALSPISLMLTSEFSRRVYSKNSTICSNAAKTRQAKSGLIPVRSVSRHQSMEPEVLLPVSGQAEEKQQGGSVSPTGTLIFPY